nr:ribonuclease H-like domain-containing protein [Tanacetum cinerariifolium]
MLLALEGKTKIGFIDGSCKRSKDDEVLGKQWDRYDAMIELRKCVCNASEGFKKHNQLLKLMKFLMGLDDSYMQIRSSILSIETLPNVRSTYATISSEESHRVAVGSIASSSQRNQSYVFVSNVPYSQNSQRSNQNFNVGPSRPNNVNNKRQSGGSGLNNNMPSEGSGLANMAGANQHMTYTDKELDNVIDISHLKIKIGHPNMTEAYISKIRNLRLPNGLTLYDVMVIPEYCVTLISVHKLIKENKVIIAFDENRCYFLNQDLNLKNVLGIGKQCEGLYYYNDKDPVLNVLKDSLNFDKKDNTICCEICQKAKQTREPFHLSDHKSKSLGDLIHLDLWRPYKVTSFERFRYFLTVVDDYTISVSGVFLALLVYVDDIIITGNSIYETEKFKVFSKSKFMIKDLGKLKYFLGIEVVDTDKGICLNQRKYVLYLLSEYGMLACKLAKTHLMSKLVIFNEASDKDPLLENITDYQKLMGMLIYLANTRPNISYVVH